jgi:cytochrome oxidase assembly protein ShyY1
VVAFVFLAGFVALGFWQLARDHQKHDKVNAAKAKYAAPAPELAAASPPPPGSRAQVTGTFDATHELILRNQVRGDTNGNDVLTPLHLADGSVVLVDRGWVADGATWTPPPTGNVVIRGIAHETQPLSPQDDVRTVNGHVSLPRVDLDRIGREIGTGVAPVWLEAQAQDPAPRAGAPKLPTPPPPDPVNHMQYAIEWFGLALIPLVGWPIVLSRRMRTPA